MQLWYLFIMHMFSSTESQSRYKRSFYVSLSSSFSTCPYQSMSFSMRYRVTTKRSASQTLECTHTCTFRVENVTHKSITNRSCQMLYTNTSNVNLLQEKVKPCCDLPKERTFPLFLLCLLHINCNSHNDALQTHRLILSLFQLTNTTDYYWYIWCMCDRASWIDERYQLDATIMIYYQKLSLHVSSIFMPIFRSTGCLLLHMEFSTRCCGCGSKGPVRGLMHGV